MAFYSYYVDKYKQFKEKQKQREIASRPERERKLEYDLKMAKMRASLETERTRAYKARKKRPSPFQAFASSGSEFQPGIFAGGFKPVTPKKRKTRKKRRTKKRKVRKVVYY